MVRRLALGFVLAAAGCASPPPDYPTTLTFTPRADRLVLKLPDSLPTHTNEPGKLDEEIAGLDARGGKTFHPAVVNADQRRALDQSLSESFGTPAFPAIRADAGVVTAGERLGLTPDRLTEGGKLFRRHCLQCHGLNGDGRGPTGLWIDPHPRDFRRGTFKFTSNATGKPSHDDLIRTLSTGLKGTAMPAFALLPEGERDLLASYVMFLAIRGQVEFQTLAAIANASDDVDGDAAGYARERLKAAIEEWQKAETPAAVNIPGGFESREGAEHEESVRRGFELFTNRNGAGCIACHEDFGRKAAYRYDVWGTIVRPADLTVGQYKRESGPEDFFRRIRNGIAASGMPAHASLSDAQVWDLVRFVRSVPFPRELPPDVRGKVDAKP